MGNRAYAVVHHDESRPIRRDLVPQHLAVVDVRDPAFRTDNLFDWITVLDHAAQLHAIDSCFLLVADMLALRCRKFLHAYTSPAVTAARYTDVIAIWG